MHVYGKSTKIRSQRLTIAITLLAQTLFYAGCLYPTDRDELFGTYVAEYEFGNDELELK